MNTWTMSKFTARLVRVSAVFLLLAACGDDAVNEAPVDAGVINDAAGTDAGDSTSDTQTTTDTQVTADTNAPDASNSDDTVSSDTGGPTDTNTSDTATVDANTEPTDTAATSDSEADTACTPQCADKACGDDGCGGVCGTCPESKTCKAGKCCADVEICNGIDDNCDGNIDEGMPDEDNDGVCDEIDTDKDNDGTPDEQDAFPNDPNEWADTDKDGTGNNADDDDDGDGLLDTEESEFGADCAVTNPLNADTDNDGVKDKDDAYPNDPFPAFVTLENNEGSISVVLSDGQGGFADPISAGKPLGFVCAAPDTNCKPGCPAGQYCNSGVCLVEDPTACDPGCSAPKQCRKIMYKGISIADFDADGKMDFIAHSWPADPDGSYQVWYFRRLMEGGQFPQQYLGQTKRYIYGTAADVNGDNFFDVVTTKTVKPNNISDVNVITFLGNEITEDTPCAAGTADDGCAFTIVPQAAQITSEVANQWGFVRSREAQDLTGDDLNDLVFGTYPNGGNSVTTVYLLSSNGDGTFAKPTVLFEHNIGGKQSPTNSMLFADFTGNTQGDVIMGLDDDGDAGAAWLYSGTDDGKFSGQYTKAIDINKGCNKGCSDKVGRTGSAKTFDFNFDGAMDIILGYNFEKVSGPPSKLVIFFGKGDGTFGEETQIGKTWSGNQANRFQSPQRLCPWYP